MVTPQLGPSITPQTLNSAGKGGQQNPPYLQMKTPVPGASPSMSQSAPVITPAPSMGGDTVKKAVAAVPTTPTPAVAPLATPQSPVSPVLPNSSSGPTITPATNANPPATGAPATPPPQAGGSTLDDVYNFFKSDLQNQTKQAKANATTDASARGVFYGTPLTGSEADIDTQYLRGLGQLQSGMYGNAQQDQLARLGLASNLGYQGLMQQPPAPAATNWSALANLFGSSPSVDPTGTQRNGPVITPKGTIAPDSSKNGNVYG